MANAKTIKQAKAAFKSRNDQVPLTDREKRQLDRGIHLERRAWSLRERERQRLEAVQKRAEKERKARAEGSAGLGSTKVLLGSQRRCDRFGHKSSQFHLGAFWRKTGGKTGSGDAKVAEVKEVGDGEGFGEDELDDESLLEALEGAEGGAGVATGRRQDGEVGMLPPPKPSTPRAAKARGESGPSAGVLDESMDLDLLEDFIMDSSTQIARELEAHSPLQMRSWRAAHSPANKKQQAVASPKEDRTGSFSSGSFELTVEDMEQLDPTPPTKVEAFNAEAKKEEARRLMPPPALPVKQHTPQGAKDKGYQSPAPRRTIITKNMNTTTTSPRDFGFTLTQLESFVDDDLQLTQIEAG